MNARSAAPRRLGLELALFAGLGGLAVAQWSRVVVDPPGAGLFGALVIACATAALLGLISIGRLPRSRILAGVIVVLGIAAGAIVVGMPARLLALPNWPELIDGIGLGLAGIEDTDLPYAGRDEWLRRTLLLLAPLLLCAGAGLGFWPARRRGLLRALGLAAVVTLYGFAVTLSPPGSELLWGVVLTVLAAAWLWVVRLEGRRAAVAIAAAVAAGVFALPAAAALDRDRPLWDYQSWDWFSGDRSVTFEWNHTYGPLDWPRQGTTLLEVKSTRPLYWKATVLDRFDGFAWQRAESGDALADGELAARQATPGGRLAETNRDWLTQATFRVEALSSELVIGTGTPQALQGVGALRSRDGTLTKDGPPLETGDEYSVVAYSPNPTAAELRRARADYPEEKFAGQVLVGLPLAGVPPPTALATTPTQMALWGDRDRTVDSALAASPYAETYELARRLTASAQTPFEAVDAIETHLRESYDYTPDVPNDTYPLRSFLFEDEAGYCQQFAGSMALMLRMVGIPARVVSGFAPGSHDSDRGVYEVRDLDAHAWVEVYFRRIGWVTFDPTPAAAPAASQTVNSEIGTFFRGRGSVADEGAGGGGSLGRGLEGGAAPGEASGSGGPWGMVALVALGLVTATGAASVVVFWRRRRRLASGQLVEAQLEELRRALDRLGWTLPREVTLLGLERRFRTAGRTGVAAYAAGLRRQRYGADAQPPPGPNERGELRRALAGGGGLRGRLRALAAIPPGGPSVKRT